MQLSRTTYIRFSILAVSLLYFLPFLGNVHLFDWDEINFAEAAREMIATGDYFRVQIDYTPFWEKPPLFIWLQALCMNIFGINEFSARLPNAVIGASVLLILYEFGKKIISERFGILWALAYFGSFLPHFYFRSGIIDPLFNLFMILSVFCFIDHNRGFGKHRLIWAGIFSGLAVLTKGPVGLALPLLTHAIAAIIQRKNIAVYFRESIALFSSALVVSLLWFGAETLVHGTWFVEEFVRYQIRLFSTGDAGHAQPWFYHFLIVFFGCFPASILAIPGMRKKICLPPNIGDEKIWMMALFAVVMIVFSIVKTKIVHYSSLSYYPVTFFAAYYLEYLLQNKKQISIVALSFLGVMGLLWTAAFIALPYIGSHAAEIAPKVKDIFARANLSAPVQWSGWEYSVGIVMLIFSILSIVFFSTKKTLYGAVSIFLGTASSISLFLPLAAAKIEGYTQHGIISFYQQHRDSNVYIQPMHFKTYAHLFYSNRKLWQSPNYRKYDVGEFETWLTRGDIDKPAYLIVKIQDEHYLNNEPLLEKYKELHGFSVYKRHDK